MEFLGNKLRLARENRNFTCDYVSREINITIRYLEALEAEDFSVFPSEAYALGFLKNYGEYLGFKSEELMSLYHAMKMQDQQIPVDLLLKSQRHFPVKILLRILLALAVLALIAGAIYFIIHLPKRETVASKPRKTREYTMTESPMERRLSLEDVFIVPYNENLYPFTLLNVGEALTIACPDGEEVMLDLGQEVVMDADKDGFNELRITAVDFVKNKPDTGARLRFELDNTPPVIEEQPIVPGIDTVNRTASTTIFSSPTPYPFTLQVVFQGYCLFRWEILAERDRQGRNEQYFERNGNLSIQAQNGIRIGVSNAAVTRIQVIGGGKTVSLELGGAGEVVVAAVHWIRDDDNRYRLVLDHLD